MRNSLFLAAAAMAGTVGSTEAQQQKGAGAPAAPATWTIDPVHSELSFRVRHLTGRVRGAFKVYEGAIVADPAALDQGAVNVTIETASISTENADRDAHLKSDDFFAVAQYPTMTFRSRKATFSGSTMTVEGDLTIKGVTKPVTLTGEFGGKINDPWGNERVGFTAETTINRRDFGLVWGKLVEGVALVGDEVQIELAVEAVKAK